MRGNDTFVAVGLPVRNGADTIVRVLDTVLAQDHENLELVISDNASDDGTEEICRHYARMDARVRYHRQPECVTLLRNFITAIRLARAPFFRWIGDDDWLEPTYVSRCLELFAEDERLLLVTTEQTFTGPGFQFQTAKYTSTHLASDRPAERFAELIRLATSNVMLDPLYALVRRDPVVAIPRRNMLREDEVFAAKMALAGPWGHVPEVLAHRGWHYERLPRTARRLGVPAWQARAATALQCRELLRYLRQVDLTPSERRHAQAAVARLYLSRLGHAAVRGARKVAVLTSHAGRSPGQPRQP